MATVAHHEGVTGEALYARLFRGGIGGPLSQSLAVSAKKPSLTLDGF